MASTSTSNIIYPLTKSCFEVFLNHRGPDTKDKFALPLYKKLDGIHDIRVFLDKEELQVGEFIASQIYEAIRAASVHVAIFSPKYAESCWCLDELHAMVESGKPIIPVFFDVDTRELKSTDGDYARALSILEKKNTHDGQLRHNPSTVQNWRTALFTVADISGLELKTFNGDEEKLLDEVVKSVLKKLNKTRFDVAEHPTGLDEKIEEFEEFLLQQQSSKPLVIGMVGMGGIGKTTFVEELFNRKSSHYNKSCFIRDVRENARKSCLESLQNKLLNSLTTWRDVEIESVDQGRHMLRTHAKSCQALLILDDVDHANQLDALLSPIREVLESNSLILITTRDKDVLIMSRVERSSIYKFPDLNPQYSKELFCLHAFTQGHLLPGFEDLVHKYLEVCDGLPLSLKVLGALLYENYDRSFWEDQLERLEQILPDDIQKRLEISYDALQRDEKEMFLDVACFFIGTKKDTAIRIWHGCGWKGSLGFQTLQNKNLVEVVGTECKIIMHDHLRDLGRDLAKKPGLPRRIWRTEDIDDLLQRSSEVTEVRGISCSSSLPIPERRHWLSFSMWGYPSFSRYKMKNLQLLDIGIYSNGYLLESILSAVQSPNLIWLRCNTGGHSCLSSSIPMMKLRVLEVFGSRLETLWQKNSQAPLQLRELQIDAPLRDIPESIGLLKHLERFQIFHSGLVKSVEVSSVIGFLRHIDLSGSWKNLKMLPESFGDLTKLQHIDLSGCRQLKRLPDSFGNLINLQHLDSPMSPLEMLPESFGGLTNLQHINLSMCRQLKRLPDSFGDLINLQRLNLSGCRLKRLPNSFGNLINLQHIDLSEYSKTKRLPDSFGNPINLQHLGLSVSDLLSVSDRISYAFWGPDLEWLSDSFGNLRRLKYLNLRGCFKLSMSSETLGNISTLEYLYLSCGMEVEVLPPQVAHQWSLKELTLQIPSLTGLPSDIGELSNLKKLELLRCRKLKCLPDSLRRLNQLTELRIEDCGLVEVGTLPDALIKLELSKLEIDGCYGPERLNQLAELRIHCCYRLVEIGTFPDALVELEVSDCFNLRKIKALYNLAKLRELRIAVCQLEELPSVEALVSLKSLITREIKKLRSISGLARLTELCEINVTGCSELKELVGVEHVSSLERLRMGECPNLELGEGVDPKIISHEWSGFSSGRGGVRLRLWDIGKPRF